MPSPRLQTVQLELTPLPVRAAAALPEGRQDVARALGAQLSSDWPDANLVGVLRRHASLPGTLECFGVWVMIERSSATVVGDIGFHGPPDAAGVVEVGYSVVPGCRRRGYATEAVKALVDWTRSQDGVRDIVAGCDPANEASIRTLSGAGFQRTGEAHGEIRWRFGPAS